MKQLPRLPRSETRQTRAQVSFGGYDHRPSCGEGGIYEMQNLTCGDAPLLATRPGRTKVHNVAMGANGLFASSAGLIWCDGNALYHDQSIIQFVTPGPKRIAELCGRVLVWPDKLCYNPAARTITDAAPTWSGAATLADGTYQGESARANTLTAQTDFTFYFRAGDAVTISGCSDAANNGTFIIREISADGKRLVFYEDTFTLPETSRSEAAVTVTRAIPDLDFVCAWGNRLWGCKDDTVYCTRLGDPLNWYWYDADENGPVSTAAWSVDTGSPGRFTGCAAYRGCVVFTKEDVLYKLYGTKPENFQLVASSLTGAEAASGASFAVADETLFFLAPSGVMATTGGTPRRIGDRLGRALTHGAAGSDGVRYYLSARDGADQAHLFVYDSARAQAETLLNQTDDPYAQEIDSLLDSLLGADFDYDPASDALYGAYRKQYLREAELAAQDALGDAAALTGGRASTAAVAASQQAGNAYRAKAADKLPELAQLAYDRYLGSRDDRRDTLDALLSARGGDRDETWKRISALLDLDKDAYERYASGIRTDQARKAASAEAEQKAQEEAEKTASQAASAAQADARTQISLILKNGGTVPAALWNKSGYDAATIAALKAGAAAQK